MVGNSERCARLLRSIWLRNGVVAASAFNLRPTIHETYISMLREEMPSFMNDLLPITKDNPVIIASLMAGDVRNLKVDDETDLSIVEVDNQRLKSHCGLFISVDGHKVVGGEPYVTDKGLSIEPNVLKVKLALANIASKNIKYVSRE